VILDRGLVKRLGIPLDHGECALRAMTETGTKPVTIDVADEAGFPIDDGDSALGAGCHAVTASIAELFVDFDDFP
jgi:hypothetical protein